MFKQLQNLETLKPNAHKKRHENAEKQLNKGLNILELAHQEAFANPERLHAASQCFIYAIKHNRNDIRPLLSMAYLFLLLEDHKMAFDYVTQALAVSPNHPDAQDFFAQIQQDQQNIEVRRALRRATLSELNRETLDYDELYDETEAFIQDTVRQVMLNPPPQVTASALNIQILRESFESLKAELSHIEQQLKIIDEEIDIADLQKLLRPLEVNCKRFETILELSQSWLELTQELQQEITLVVQVSEEAEKTQDPDDLAVLIENQEVLLDNYTGYSHRIQNLSKQGVFPPEIEEIQEKLLLEVEKFQEVLEDTEVRLTPGT